MGIEIGLTLTLARAPDDPPQFSDEIQAELFGIHETLRKRGVSVSSVGWHPSTVMPNAAPIRAKE
jgi:hypothetical protein